MAAWLRPAVIVEVHDGDTVIVDVDLGRHCAHRGHDLELGWHVRADEHGRLWLRCAVRIEGIAAPELPTPEGKAARDYARKLLPQGVGVTLVSKKLLGSFEKYGRVLGDLTFPPPVEPRSVEGDFATAMIAAGHALEWDGRGKQPA